MTYRPVVVTRGSAAILVLGVVIAASCGGGTAPSTITTTGATATNAALATATASSGRLAGGASFGQILGSAATSEYKVTYKLLATDGGEQSWYSKPPKARYDFISSVSGQTATVSIYSLPDGTFMCFGGTAQTAQCIGMTGLSTALQQNPAALYQQTMIQHPDQFSAVLVETRQIAGQQAQCFDVKAAVAIAALTDGRFCYSAQGILLLQRFSAERDGQDMEATTVSMTVPDSDFTLPAQATIIGKP
jgi:hypothetical protein